MPSKKPLEVMAWAEALWSMYGGENPRKIGSTLMYEGKGPQKLWITLTNGFIFSAVIIGYGLGWIKVLKNTIEVAHVILTKDQVISVVVNPELQPSPPDEVT